MTKYPKAEETRMPRFESGSVSSVFREAELSYAESIVLRLTARYSRADMP